MKISGMPRRLMFQIARFFAGIMAGVCVGMVVVATSTLVRDFHADVRGEGGKRELAPRPPAQMLR
jgi:hypothetical protein